VHLGSPLREKYHLRFHRAMFGYKSDISGLDQLGQFKLIFPPLRDIEVCLELFKHEVDLLKLLDALLDAELCSVGGYLKEECQGCDVKHIFTNFIAQLAQVLKHLVLLRNLAMPLEVVAHLCEVVVAESIIVDLLRDGCPAELEMRRGLVEDL
jgi:hypothetical protein